MGFTGEKAMVWKLKFLDAFNAMEKALLKQASTLDYAAVRLQTKNVRTGLTDAVQNFVAYAVAQGSKSAPMYYANITKMEYKALDLLDKQKTSLGNFRDTLDLMDLCYLQAAELIAKGALEKGMQDKMHYKERLLLTQRRFRSCALRSEFLETCGYAGKPYFSCTNQSNLKAVSRAPCGKYKILGLCNRSALYDSIINMHNKLLWPTAEVHIHRTEVKHAARHNLRGYPLVGAES
jgi:hypothetical protein